MNTTRSVFKQLRQDKSVEWRISQYKKWQRKMEGNEFIRGALFFSVLGGSAALVTAIDMMLQ